MGTFARSVRAIMGTAGAVVLAAAQFSPETAVSNLAAWANLLGLGELATAMPHSADVWGRAIGGLLLLGAIIWWLLIRRKQTIDWEPVWKAIQRIAERTGEPKNSEYFPKARAALRQSAKDGSVKLRGRKQLPNKFGSNQYVLDSIFTEIEPKYWDASVLLATAATAPLIGGAAIPQTLPVVAGAWGADKCNAYADIQVERGAALK